jgi:hypothetical protein
MAKNLKYFHNMFVYPIFLKEEEKMSFNLESEAMPQKNSKQRNWSWIPWVLFIILAGLFLGYVYIQNQKPAEVAAVKPPVNVQNNPAVISTSIPLPSPTPKFVWDGKFTGVAEFYIDGDPQVEGFKTKNVPMKYTCVENFGVFVTMDPGSIQGISTVDHGAVAFVPCTKGKIVNLTTPHWSDSAEHQQIHLVEITKKLPDTVSFRDLLLSLKLAEGKPVAFMFSADGKYEEIK